MKVWNTASSRSHTYFKPLVITSICGGCLRPFNTNWKSILCFVLFFVFIAVPSNSIAIWKAVECITENEAELRDRNLGLYITYACLSLSCLLPTLLGVVYFPKKLSKLLKAYDNLRTDPRFEIHLSKSRMFMKIFISITVLMTVAVVIFMIFRSPPFMKASCIIAPLSFQKSNILLWISVGFMPVQSSLIFLQRLTTYGFIIFLTYIVRREFTHLNMEFEKLVTTTVTVQRIEIIKKRYFDICDFVTSIDDFLTPLISIYLAYSLTAICFNIHALVYGLLATIEVIFYCVVVGLTVTEMILIMINGNLIVTKSKCCLETSKHFNMNKLNTQTMSALTLFVENIKSSEVGLSFMKLFIVDKNAMLTLTGTLFTYIVVVLQMQPSSTD